MASKKAANNSGGESSLVVMESIARKDEIRREKLQGSKGVAQALKYELRNNSPMFHEKFSKQRPYHAMSSARYVKFAPIKKNASTLLVKQQKELERNDTIFSGQRSVLDISNAHKGFLNSIEAHTEAEKKRFSLERRLVAEMTNTSDLKASTHEPTRGATASQQETTVYATLDPQHSNKFIKKHAVSMLRSRNADLKASFQTQQPFFNQRNSG